MPPTSTPRRKRPHPARRARIVTGALSVAGMSGITGYLVASYTPTHTASAAAATASSAPPTTSTTLASTDAVSTSAATAAAPSTSASTSSHGS